MSHQKKFSPTSFGGSSAVELYNINKHILFYINYSPTLIKKGFCFPTEANH